MANSKEEADFLLPIRCVNTDSMPSILSHDKLFKFKSLIPSKLHEMN